MMMTYDCEVRACVCMCVCVCVWELPLKYIKADGACLLVYTV